MGDISRRSFLKGGAFLAAGAAAATAVGCAPQSEGGEKNTPVASTGPGQGFSADQSIAVYDADVLIVGGGLSSMTAARRILQEGGSIAIIDKGLFGHSGASGINWGHQVSSLEFTDEATIEAFAPNLLFSGDGVIDQTIHMSVCKAWAASTPIQTGVRTGSVTDHHEDGRSMSQLGKEALQSQQAQSPLVGDSGIFPRNMARDLKRKGVNVYEHHFVLDVLKGDDGSAVGVAAVNLETGEPVVFRGKSVIMATGSYAWLSGWNGMTPYTHSSADCTGDGTAMMIRAGIPMRDMEELCQDNGQWYPSGTRQCMTGMGVELPDYYRGFNVNKESFTSLIDENPAQYMNQGCYMRMTLREIYQGRGTEHGGIYALTDDVEKEERYYRPCKWNMERIFDWELPQYVELVPQVWETAGRPFDLNPETCETVVPGLFYSGGAPFVWNGFVVASCMGTAWLAGKGAADRAREIDLGAIDWNQVNEVFEQAYSVFEKDSSEGIRSRTLMRNVQTSFWDGMYFLRDEQGIQGTIDELTRIQEEDLPNMHLGSTTKAFNNDWRYALEARNMALVGTGAAEAAIIRKECRGTHCRTDFPQQDNSIGLVNTKVAYDNGVWSSELVPIDETLIPAETIAAAIGVVGLE